ncbi:AAA family ATPase [Agrobacterium rosae]|uniref:Recombination protein F n=1 Tax=Agrobacterium rosae TaxID=1972867 RepID=A0A1R3U685_9HYPH|nr:AAA family ATPase [Agrobacterium rosae]SCX31776.1 recombination protein F [Agrobacterium rosae]
MIFVDRDGEKSPLNDEILAHAGREIQNHYSLEPSMRRQTKLDLQAQWHHVREVISQPLARLFNNKCAYCETLFSSSDRMAVDRFRPSSGASDLTGRGSVDHYGWLSFEWRNLYPICSGCNRAKRSFFPVDGERAPLLATIDMIDRQEKAMLLNPCRDDPEEHLEFIEDGSVRAITKKGEITIKVFNLNRSRLREQRRSVYAETLSIVTNAPSGDGEVPSDQPFVAVSRAAAASLRNRLKPLQSFAVPEESRSAETVIDVDEEAFRLTARPLQSISIRNFRMLREVDLTFPEPNSTNAPWLMLLGENASGKSTLLQAIALALAGAEEASRLTKPSRVLSSGAAHGQVSLRFWDNTAPVELLYSRGEKLFGGAKRPSAIVLAYGSLRYPDARARDAATSSSPLFARVAPLVKQVAKLPFHRTWLRELPDEQFDVVGRALKEILPIQQDAVFTRKNGRLFFRNSDHLASLSEMSAGYQSIVAVCLDIIQLLFERWETLQSATAVVIIDEIDAHLHPRWKMRIVESLRAAMPQVQFIASTHDPLVLRGLRNGEVALMERDDNNAVIANRNLPPIEGMQVDDLLVSRHFGLSSTVDPTSEALYNEYYHLLSLPADAVRDRRINELRSRLGDREAFGRNRRENLLLALADEALAETKPVTKQDLKDTTLSRLRSLAASRTAIRSRG